MRILHIHKFFNYQGGAEVYLHRIMERQVARGHEVHILTTRGPDNAESPDRKYFVHRYDFTKSDGVRGDAQKALAFLWNREAKRATERALQELKPDIIHLHNIYHHLSSSILAPIRRSQIRCVQTLHDLKLACPNYSMFTEGSVCERCKGGKYWNPVLHHCLAPSTAANLLAAAEMSMTKIFQSYEKTVHAFICPSQFMRDKMVEWGEPASKMTVLRNPADVSSHAAVRGGGYLLYAGRLSEGKGIEPLIRASANVPSLPLKIAGRGPLEERMKHLVRTLGASHVQFLGFIPPTELETIRHHAEAVVVPSMQYDNSPLSLLGAMGQGLPVLASKIGGIPEIAEDQVHGLLAVPGDTQAWVANLQAFQQLTDDQRTAMGRSGRERIRARHDWEQHLEGLERIYYGKSGSAHRPSYEVGSTGVVKSGE
ncbi:glycosyltransferase [Candidatus Uhrbacteria bacterium]|nr:glycosyltransferase [Candidatus Uhrbacteria bacterium]MBD3284027.1 glycosyltransferase [Candidatus Uhrbacteria bacterium]